MAEQTKIVFDVKTESMAAEFRDLNKQIDQLSRKLQKLEVKMTIDPKIAEALGKIAEQAKESEGAIASLGKAFSSVFNTASTAIVGELMGGLRGQYNRILNTTRGLNTLSGSFIALGRATAASAKMFAAFSLPLAAFMALGFAVQLLTDKIKKDNEEKKKQVDAIKTITSNYAEQKSTITELIHIYNQLNEQTLDGKAFINTEQQEKYFNITKQLGELLPNLVKEIDEKGNVHLKSAEAMAKELEYSEKLTKIENRRKYLDANKTLDKDLDTRNLAQEELDLLRRKIFYAEKPGNTSRLTKKEVLDLKQDEVILSQEVDGLTEKLNSDLSTYMTAFADFWGLKLNESITYEFNKAIGKMDTTQLNGEETLGKLQEIGSAMQTIQSTMITEDTDPTILNEYNEAINTLSKSLNLTEAEALDFIGSLKGIKKGTDNLKIFETFNKTKEAIEPLNQAIHAMSNGQLLSSEAVTDLVYKYPQLSGQVTILADGYRIETSALENLRKEKILKAKDDLENERKSTLATQVHTISRMKAYGVELTGIQSLDDAKKKIEEAKAKQGLAHLNPFKNMFPKITTNTLENEDQAVIALEEQYNKSKAIVDEHNNQIRLLEDALNNSKQGTQPTSIEPLYSDEDPRSEAYQKEMSEYEHRVKMQGLNTNEQLYQLNLIGEAHKELLAESRSDEISYHEKVHDLNQQLTDEKVQTEEDRKQAEEEHRKLQFKHSEDWIAEQTTRMELAGNSELEIAQMVLEARKRMNAERWAQELNISKLSEAEQLAASKNVYEAQKKVNDLQKTNQEKSANNAKEVIKQISSAYQDYYDGLLKAEDKRHEKELKNLDEKMEKYEESINLIKKSLNREAEAEDYEEALSKAQKEAQAIQEQINKHAMDNSIEGQARKAELMKEYALQQEEIEDMEKERTRTLLENNLDDMLDMKQKEIEAAKDTENAKFEINKESLENQKLTAENYWNDILNNDAKFASVQKDILNGQFLAITTEMDVFKTNIASLSSVIGDAISTNITGKLENAKNALTGYRTNPLGDISNNFVNEKDVIKQMKINSDAWNKRYANSPKDQKILEDANRELGASIGATYKNGTWYKNDIPLYHNGGEVGVDGTTQHSWWQKMLLSNEIPAILKKGEIVLSQPMHFIHDMVNRMMSGLPFSSPIAAAGGGDTYYNLDVRIDKLMGGKEGADTFFKEIKKGMQTGRRI